MSDPKTVAFAVITYYPKWYQGSLRSIRHTDKVRGDLALEFFKKAMRKGYQVVCSDGHSSKSFKQALHDIKDVVVVNRRAKKRSPAKRRTLKLASRLDNVKAIVLTEAEKVSLLNYIPEITSPIVNDSCDIVVPRREEHLFKSTYPGYMYESEIEGNRIYNEALASHGLLPPELTHLDTFFGPRVVKNNQKVLRLFMQRFSFKIGGYTLTSALFDPEEISDVQFFPVVEALQKDMVVKSVEIPFSYPTLQKDNEELGAKLDFIAKRNHQRLGILVNLMHFLGYLEGRRKTNLRRMKP